MSLIEGVGDEVTDFFIVLSIILVAWFAWCSTNIADQPIIRTVLILQHRTRTSITELRASQNTITLNQSRNLEISEEDSIETNTIENNHSESSCPETSVGDATTPALRRVPEPTTSEEILIETMDSFNNEETIALEKPNKESSTDESNLTESMCTSTECPSDNLSTANANEISIKLKFINDDQKVVTGSLKEMLGDFKRRHFQVELDSQKLVRLVFKGQVLQPDSQTLERCGLYNHCVVHCLVHQPRPATTSSRPHTLEDSSIYFNTQTFQDLPAGNGVSSVHNEWDLSRLLMSILALILGLAWYSRYHYAQFFTATATIVLYALTAIFTVPLFSNFFPDQDSIRNIE
ncbi:PREDICTED: transmembrane and ubiquitin-like domain-containing protein 1 [Polistes dominula]|uniref:Transmembrane and ubiquitin-like domain-containing protein 1 n=1 Tax=Polistes dominula TaxID=743375 RepID=A0ABM1I5T8_POLDO|nr:PREDICTED: transmembrane and ubiquitin-like domain-containing protein 1 [Polistes dominula]XP_015175572.1 PREDICTED: transmembrane and ubiquitin-like domain-containing protein 1 [Polistes dominula]XP_015175573.1 PREDICTED: transmembrane and ubiquitin-like domain-containing protein 1 [Polistes dominula]XP_015175574.1 PREDICTED: transmembrane and ubiquitin-like domain-containing protein 1 [Polistes dominula]XP_015175575.1 PREDICTED: transmembrane and ubiquitin-like domain-containing protein 1 